MFCPFIKDECEPECALRIESGNGTFACSFAHLATQSSPGYCVSNTESASEKTKDSDGSEDGIEDDPATISECVRSIPWVKNPNMCLMNGYVTLRDLQRALPSALRRLCLYNEEDLRALAKHLREEGIPAVWESDICENDDKES